MTPPRPWLGGGQNDVAAAAELGSLADCARPHFGRCLPKRRGRGVAGDRGAQIPDRWILAFRGSVSCIFAAFFAVTSFSAFTFRRSSDGPPEPAGHLGVAPSEGRRAAPAQHGCRAPGQRAPTRRSPAASQVRRGASVRFDTLVSQEGDGTSRVCWHFG